MRLEHEVEQYSASARIEFLLSCSTCQGKNPDHECWNDFHDALKKYESCIPRDFWEFDASDVKYNVEQFQGIVAPYMKKLSTALQGGYGLLMLGDNGVGKTMFLCMVLNRAIKRGFSTYYTTLLELDHNLKRGFGNREIADRLEWYLTSDFLVLDELGKEQFKSGDSYIRTQVERILKRRYDDSRPTLLATNTSMDELESMYGHTITSILLGKYRSIQMDPGDFRNEMSKKMREDMGI